MLPTKFRYFSRIKLTEYMFHMEKRYIVDIKLVLKRNIRIGNTIVVSTIQNLSERASEYENRKLNIKIWYLVYHRTGILWGTTKKSWARGMFYFHIDVSVWSCSQDKEKPCLLTWMCGDVRCIYIIFQSSLVAACLGLMWFNLRC